MAGVCHYALTRRGTFRTVAAVHTPPRIVPMFRLSNSVTIRRKLMPAWRSSVTRPAEHEAWTTRFFRAFHALTVTHASRGTGLSLQSLAAIDVECMMDPL